MDPCPSSREATLLALPQCHRPGTTNTKQLFQINPRLFWQIELPGYLARRSLILFSSIGASRIKQKYYYHEKARVARLEVERAWIRARRPGPNFWLALNTPQAQGYTSLISEKAWTRLEPGLIRLHMYKARAWSWLEGYFNRLGLVWARYPEALAKVGLKEVGSFQF